MPSFLEVDTVLLAGFQPVLQDIFHPRHHPNFELPSFLNLKGDKLLVSILFFLRE